MTDFETHESGTFQKICEKDARIAELERLLNAALELGSLTIERVETAADILDRCKRGAGAGIVLSEGQT